MIADIYAKYYHMSYIQNKPGGLCNAFKRRNQ